jgi:TPR repeat protein
MESKFDDQVYSRLTELLLEDNNFGEIFNNDPIKKYRVGAAHGNIGCMMAYADHCYSEKKYVEMEKYYKLAAEQNMSYAIIHLVLYYKGIRKYRDMIKYCHQLHDNKIFSDYDLGVFYMIIDDRKSIFKYFISASQQGNINAMLLLSDYYYEQNDYENRIKYLNMAVDKKSPEAMYRLGLIYEEQGFKKSAKKYFDDASNYDHMKAKEKLKSYQICSECIIL